MIGSRWTNIQGFAQRQTCTICDMTESMDHIIARCDANTTRIPWEMAKAAWPHRDAWWPNINLGIILGIGCVSIPAREENQNQNLPNQDHPRTNRLKGPTRLLQLLISEMAHLVWVLRCERVIRDEKHTDQQIKSRWLHAINDRLTCDRIIATKIKRDEKHTHLVKTTWGPLLRKQGNLPDDWITNREVLVGSGA